MTSTLKFNAGKVLYDEESKKCTPLPHKGTITIEPNAHEDSFFDFTWHPKTSSGNVEPEDFLIIPGDVTFKQVKSCKTGRVFALTFLSSGAKNLYWLQDVGDEDYLDKLTEKDEKIVKQVTDMILEASEEAEDSVENDSKDVKMED